MYASSKEMFVGRDRVRDRVAFDTFTWVSSFLMGLLSPQCSNCYNETPLAAENSLSFGSIGGLVQVPAQTVWPSDTNDMHHRESILNLHFPLSPKPQCFGSRRNICEIILFIMFLQHPQPPREFGPAFCTYPIFPLSDCLSHGYSGFSCCQMKTLPQLGKEHIVTFTCEIRSNAT